MFEYGNREIFLSEKEIHVSATIRIQFRLASNLLSISLFFLIDYNLTQECVYSSIKPAIFSN